ncbi:MAG: hypothetical protein IIZ23_00265, partial [Ruminococcus sp.]|nr:hypothetical protein [Ruminococcus sp.]
PEIKRLGAVAPGGFSFAADPRGYTAIEAEHWAGAQEADGTRWTVIPGMGRTRSGVALMPYTAAAEGAEISAEIIDNVDAAAVYIENDVVAV